MSGRGGIYEGPGGQKLYGDGREVNPVESLKDTPDPRLQRAREYWAANNANCEEISDALADFAQAEVAPYENEITMLREEREKLRAEVARAYEDAARIVDAEADDVGACTIQRKLRRVAAAIREAGRKEKA